jgi:ABC-type nitrate/sulfonate/bicarbonate transport system substrate-binding protein
MQGTKLSDMLLATPDIKNAQDLKGKQVAISTFGGTSHASALILLGALGLTDKDVTIQQVGGDAARFAAVQSGAVESAVVDILHEDDAKKLGLNILTTSAAAPGTFARSALITQRAFAEKNPNTVLDFVAANLESMQALYTMPDKAADAYMKMAQLQNREDAVEGIKAAEAVDTRNMRWTKDAFDLAQKVAAVANPAVASVDVTKAYTFKFLDQLRDMGFNDAIGVPKS